MTLCSTPRRLITSTLLFSLFSSTEVYQTPIDYDISPGLPSNFFSVVQYYP